LKRNAHRTLHGGEHGSGRGKWIGGKQYDSPVLPEEPRLKKNKAGGGYSKETRLRKNQKVWKRELVSQRGGRSLAEPHAGRITREELKRQGGLEGVLHSSTQSKLRERKL